MVNSTDRPNWALILAGGRGERLRPLTDLIPKPMVHVAGRPILEHQVRWLMGHGIKNIVFLTGYLEKVIHEYFGDGSRFGFQAHYSHEDEPLGRGGAIRKALEIVPKDEAHVVAMNGDNITNQNLWQMFQQHIETNAVATLLLAPYTTQYGVVTTQGLMVKEFKEKGSIPGLFINAGVYFFRRGIWRLLPIKGDHETTTFSHLSEQMSLGGYPLHPASHWLTMDSPADVERVERFLHP